VRLGGTVGESQDDPAPAPNFRWAGDANLRAEKLNCRVATIRRMTIQRLENVGIVVDDLAAATTFFVELGLTVLGEGPVEGGWDGSN
jgi:hypothetical protein